MSINTRYTRWGLNEPHLYVNTGLTEPKKFNCADEITPLDVDAAVDKALRKQNKKDGFAELDALEKELTRIACFLGE